MKELIIIEKQEQKDICFVEDGILKEYYKEMQDRKRLEGNIYAGKVVDVLNGMQAAFIDIKEDKNAFLHIKDVLPKKSSTTGNKEESIENYKIKDYIKPNQMLLVQVKKDSNNIKGARVSTNLQIPGRFVVLLPENDFITVSQKIESAEEKKRLVDLVKQIKGKRKIGIIIRTSAESKNVDIIEKDFMNAIDKLNKIKEKFEKLKDKQKPEIIQENATILEKILVDLSDNELERIITNSEKTKKQIQSILKQNGINLNIEIQKENLEEKYELKKQIEKRECRKIWLKCGGFITIDKTEALTAIDVNSGKFTGTDDLEKTVLKVNKEASLEIAKQLRLRDIGGIVVIDYIDMFEENSKKEVIETLKNALKEDRAKTQIMDFTKLNLLEMTRKHMFSEE